MLWQWIIEYTLFYSKINLGHHLFSLSSVFSVSIWPRWCVVAAWCRVSPLANSVPGAQRPHLAGEMRRVGVARSSRRHDKDLKSRALSAAMGLSLIMVA